MQLKFKDINGGKHSLRALRVTEHFCVHKDFGFPEPWTEPTLGMMCFTVSHISSGANVGAVFKTKRQAIYFAKELERLWPNIAKKEKDWKKTAGRLSKEEKRLTKQAKVRAVDLERE